MERGPWKLWALRQELAKHPASCRVPYIDVTQSALA